MRDAMAEMWCSVLTLVLLSSLQFGDNTYVATPNTGVAKTCAGAHIGLTYSQITVRAHANPPPRNLNKTLAAPFCF